MLHDYDKCFWFVNFFKVAVREHSHLFSSKLVPFLLDFRLFVHKKHKNSIKNVTFLAFYFVCSGFYSTFAVLEFSNGTHILDIR